MDWIGDFVRFCLSGFGGWILLAVTTLAVLAGALMALSVAIRLGKSFGRGLRQGVRSRT